MAVIVILGLVAPLVLVGIVLVVVFSLTRKGKREQPGWQPQVPYDTAHAAPAQQAPVGAAQQAPSGSGVWNAQVMGGGLLGALGGTLNATFGRFVLADGNLSFLPDGNTQPAWTVPCRELFFTHYGALSTAAVELRGPMGTVRCDVSLEHINRLTRNSAKTLREAGHARGFVQALAAYGARGA